jgi:excisionase family DNA binding protein
MPLPASIECGTYSVTDAARRLGISRRHAYQLIERDEFPVRVLRAGGQLLVPGRCSTGSSQANRTHSRGCG